MSNNTIKVTGKGQIILKPDTTRIWLTLEDTKAEYDKAIQASTEQTMELKQVLSKLGFQAEDIKTLDFHVDPEKEGYTEKGVYKQRLIGYQYHHELRIQFASDNTRLGEILYALSHCSLHPEFEIGYTVKDVESAKNLLLAKAVKDAKAKAEVLAEAAGVTLKEIQNIDYSWGQLDLEVRPMRLMRSMNYCVDSAESSIDIEPDDIDVSDTVTVVWEI